MEPAVSFRGTAFSKIFSGLPLHYTLPAARTSFTITINIITFRIHSSIQILHSYVVLSII